MHSGFQRLSVVLQESGAQKASTILADPLQALRLELNQADLSTHDKFSAAAAKIKALILHYYPEAQREEANQVFDRELLRAEQAIATGSSKKVLSNGRYDDNGPNLYAPERMLLWYATMSHMEQVQPEEGKEKISTATVANELAQSKGADYLLDKFSAQVTQILAALKIDKKDCLIRWGEPDSHFWHRKKDPENGVPHDIINFDIKKTLLIGDLVQQVMLHELGHYLNDTHYPEPIKQLTEDINSLEHKRQEGTLTEEERKAFFAACVERKLYHSTWNSAADNAVDEATCRLSSGEQPVYHANLLPGLLTNFVTLRGQGKHLQAYEHKGPLPPEELAEQAGNPEARLTHLNNALFQVTSLMHGQMKDPSDRAALLEDLPKLGIYPELFRNFDKPELTGEECFWDLYNKCKTLAELTPAPDVMAMPARWREQRDAMQEQRNKIHEAIFAEYATSLIKRVVEQKKPLQELIEILGDLPFPGQPGSNAPAIPGGAIGIPKPVAEHEKDAGNEKNSRDPEAAKHNNNVPTIKGLKPVSTMPKQSTMAGKAIDAIAELNLGDGKSLKELQNDPLWVMAIDQIATRMEEMMADFAVPIHHVAHHASQLLPKDNPAARLDQEYLKRYALGKVQGIPHFFRDDETTYIPPIGDVLFGLDISGSMGWGKNTHAEYVIKATVLMMLGIQQFNEDRQARNLPEMGAYVMLWGNIKPTFLGKPYGSAGKEEVIAKLDEVLRKVLASETVPGAHGGTELTGTFQEVFEEYAHHRPNSGSFNDVAERGPILMLLGSDGHVFDMDKVPMSRILQAVPALTVDTMLTKGEDSVLHKALLAAEPAEEYQRAVCIAMNDKQAILPGMLDWMEKRMETFRDGLPWGTTYEVFTEGGIAEQAEEALALVGRDVGFRNRLSPSPDLTDRDNITTDTKRTR